MPPTIENSTPKEHLIAARLRALAENCLYQDHGADTMRRLESYLNDSARLHPEAVETYLLMARAYELTSPDSRRRKSLLNKQIAEVLNAALERDPGNSQAKVMLASLFIELGDSKLALEYLRDIIGQRGGDSCIYEQAGDCYYLLGSLGEAEGAYDRALMVQPRSHELRLKHGLTLYARCKYLEAYLEAQKALILLPNQREAVRLKKAAAGRAARQAGRPLRDFEESFAAEISPALKEDLYKASYESDPLTGFASEGSLRLWATQTHLKDVWALAAHATDLCVISLVRGKDTADTFLRGLAAAMRSAYPGAVFMSRPRADKMVIFTLEDPTGALPAFWRGLDELLEVCRPGVGVGRGRTALAALGSAIKESLKESSA